MKVTVHMVREPVVNVRWPDAGVTVKAHDMTFELDFDVPPELGDRDGIAPALARLVVDKYSAELHTKDYAYLEFHPNLGERYYFKDRDGLRNGWWHPFLNNEGGQ